MDDATNARLRGAADECIAAYDRWTKSKKDLNARENLMEALHELRKVASRLEIEVAVSERDEMTQRPIPIPPHRASQIRPGSEQSGDMGSSNDEPRGRGPSRDAGPGGEGRRRFQPPRTPRPVDDGNAQ